MDIKELELAVEWLGGLTTPIIEKVIEEKELDIDLSETTSALFKLYEEIIEITNKEKNAVG